MGGDLPKGRETKENYGKTLKIEKVSDEDRGRYRCTATNFLGSATHDFQVTVEGTRAAHADLRLPCNSCAVSHARHTRTVEHACDHR